MLPAGGCTGVVGRSGSGKTTLARCVAGLHERHRGEIRLTGRELPVLRRRSDGEKRRVQYVWQEVRGSFDERRPVLDQVARTAVRLRGQSAATATARAVELLESLGVAHGTARRHPTGLSGGELQRAALARALLAAPEVLICDEITTALDEPAADLVLTQLARLRRDEGMAVLWIGHDLELVRALAERLLVLDGGGVAEDGDCARIMAAPRAEATRQLLAAATIPTADRPAPTVERP